MWNTNSTSWPHNDSHHDSGPGGSGLTAARMGSAESIARRLAKIVTIARSTTNDTSQSDSDADSLTLAPGSPRLPGRNLPHAYTRHTGYTTSTTPSIGSAGVRMHTAVTAQNDSPLSSLTIMMSPPRAGSASIPPSDFAATPTMSSPKSEKVINFTILGVPVCARV